MDLYNYIVLPFIIASCFVEIINYLYFRRIRNACKKKKYFYDNIDDKHRIYFWDNINHLEYIQNYFNYSEIVGEKYFRKVPINEIYLRSKNFYELLKKRRSIRSFDKTKIKDEIIKNAILAAGTAPNGANLQPWHFVIIKDKLINLIIK